MFAALATRGTEKCGHLYTDYKYVCFKTTFKHLIPWVAIILVLVRSEAYEKKFDIMLYLWKVLLVWAKCAHQQLRRSHFLSLSLSFTYSFPKLFYEFYILCKVKNLIFIVGYFRSLVHWYMFYSSLLCQEIHTMIPFFTF